MAVPKISPEEFLETLEDIRASRKKPKTRPGWGTITKRKKEHGFFKFGKHKNKPLDDVPVGYLVWVMNTFGRRITYLQKIVDDATAELNRR